MTTSPHPTLVRFVVSDSALDVASERDAEAARLLRSVPWWYRWIPSGPRRFVSSPLPAPIAAEVRVALAGAYADGPTEIDVTDRYAFGSTTAPVACDVGGTVTASPSVPPQSRDPAPWRLVAIPLDVVDMQAACYAAGRHPFELVSSPGETAPPTSPREPGSEAAEALEQLDDGGLDLPDFPSGLPLDTTLGRVSLTVTDSGRVYALFPEGGPPLTVHRARVWGSVRLVRQGDGCFHAEVGPTDISAGRRRPASDVAQREVAETLAAAVGEWARTHQEVFAEAHAMVVAYRTRVLRREIAAHTAALAEHTRKIREKREQLRRLDQPATGAR